MVVSCENRREPHHQVARGPGEARVMPERAFKLCPEPNDPVIVRDHLHAFPKSLAQSITVLRMRKGFTVQASFLPADLQSDCAEDIAIRTFNELKLLEALLEFVRR